MSNNSINALKEIVSGLRSCRLCWRITATVFMTILVTEAIILFFSVDRYRTDRLHEVEREGLVIARSIIREAQKQGDIASKIAEIGPRLRKNTALSGIVVNDDNGTSIGQFGELPSSFANQTVGLSKTLYRYLNDGQVMDVAWSPRRTRLPFTILARVNIEEIKPQINSFIKRIIGLIFLISATLTVVTMVVLERLVLQPIRHLQEGVSDVANDPKNHTAKKLSSYGTDELGDVTRGFDLLTERLDGAFKQIERQNAKLFEKELAEQSNRVKSQFMANMSHELRTPLNAVLGFADIIRNQYLGPIGQDQYLQYAEDISQGGQHLLGLVNQILEVEEIEAGSYTPVKEDTDIHQLISTCWELFQEQAKAKQLTLLFGGGSVLPPINADKQVLKRIFTNILSNAVKFTSENGQIEVDVYTTPSNCTIEISDTGGGIPEEKLVRITDPFSRHEADPYKAQDGLGLGLTIAKGLVAMLGGDFKIVSELGKGTMVKIEIPAQWRYPHRVQAV